MITDTKFYKPSVAKLTDKEIAFFNEGLSVRYGMLRGVDPKEIDFVMPNPTTIMTRRVAMTYTNKPKERRPEYKDMGAFQITYNFSKAVRNNLFNYSKANGLVEKREYGASGWSFRALYEFLCERYNNGKPFIDSYFESIFKTRPVYQRFLSLYNDIHDEINSEKYDEQNAQEFDLFQSVPLKADGTPDTRYSVSKKFMEFGVWKDPIIKERCKAVAKEIRDDIVSCLYMGRIPMSGRPSATVSQYTARIRSRLDGMNHPNRLFFASGSLISHLNIHVEVAAGADKGGRAA